MFYVFLLPPAEHDTFPHQSLLKIIYILKIKVVMCFKQLKSINVTYMRNWCTVSKAMDIF